MKRLIIQSVAVSTLVVIGITLCTDLFFTRVFTVSLDEDRMETINAMPHEQAMVELAKHQKPVKGLSYVLQFYPDPMMWKAKARPMLTMLAFSMTGCLWMGMWSEKRNRENSQHPPGTYFRKSNTTP